MNSLPLRSIRSYTRRHNRITPAQKKALENWLSVYGCCIENGLVDWPTVFGRTNPLILEIGFGMGESLITMAKQHPENDFIGIEVHAPGVGSLLKSIEENQLTNIRIFHQDAMDALAACISNECLSKIQLFFPDPWPKRRHHKRRLIQPNFLQLAQQKLKLYGILHIATDWENYADHIEQILSEAVAFQKLDQEAARAHVLNRSSTRFERRGKALNHPIFEFVFIKKSTNPHLKTAGHAT